MKWRFTLSNTTAGSLVLADEPIGWVDSVLEFKRDKDWHGIFFNYALALKFYETGYDYLKDIYDTAGIDEYVELLVEISCAEGDPFEEFYVGKVLMGTLLFDCDDDCLVEARIDPAGCLMTFRNRIDQKVDLDANLDFDGNSLTAYTGLGTSISLPPKAIVRRTHGQADPSNPATDLTHNDTSGQQVVNGTGSQTMTDVAYFQIPYNSFDLTEINTVNAQNCSYASSPGLLSNFFICSEIGSYEFIYTMDLFLKSRARFQTPAGINEPDCWTGSSQLEYYVFEDWKVEIQAYKNSSTLIYSNTLLNTTGNCSSNLASGAWGKQNTFIPSGNFTVACVPGDTVQFCLQITIGGSWERSLLLNNDITFDHVLDFGIQDITVKGTITNPPTPCQVYLINEALSRTVEGITDDCLRVYSDYYGREDAQPYTSPADGCGSLRAIMKGLHIRQFPSADVLMAVSFKELYDALNSVDCIGIGIEPDPNRPGNDQLRIEPFAHWYDDTTILLQCDNVPALKRRVTADGYCSIFAFGYEKWEAEDSMGLDEFNTKREFRTTRKEVKNTLDKKCKFIGSGYAIEVTRSQPYTNDSTKDWRWDNDTFLLCIRRDTGSFAVEQGIDCADTTTMTDIIDPPSLYNYRISPIRNLMRWARVLFTNYYPDINAANAQFVFNSGDGNFKVKGALVNGCFQEAGNIAENDTITTASFLNSADAQPVHISETIEFDYPVSWQDVRAWRLNPSLLRGMVRYRTRSTNAWSEGFILQLSYKPVNGLATFTLLPKFS